MKLEPARTKNPQLLTEAKFLQQIAGGLGVPRVYWSGVDGDHNAMAIELLGSSLESLFRECSKRFTNKSVLMLGDQLVNRLEYMHSKGLIHRDVKPDNFVMGLGKKAHLVHVIDLGLAKRYRHAKTCQHFAYAEGCTLTGTARYASINTHLGVEQSRRDDLESVAYVLMYLSRGGVPWQGLKANSKKEKYQKILQRKISTPIETLVGNAPIELAHMLRYCRELKFEEQPNYDYVRSLLRGALARLRYPYDLRFDWLPGTDARAPSRTPSSVRSDHRSVGSSARRGGDTDRHSVLSGQAN